MTSFLLQNLGFAQFLCVEVAPAPHTLYCCFFYLNPHFTFLRSSQGIKMRLVQTSLGGRVHPAGLAQVSLERVPTLPSSTQNLHGTIAAAAAETLRRWEFVYCRRNERDREIERERQRRRKKAKREQRRGSQTSSAGG